MPPIVRRRKSLGMIDERNRDGSRSRRPKATSNAPPNSCKACIQFLLVSSVIPLLFFLRLQQQSDGHTAGIDAAFLRATLSIPETLPEPFSFLPPLLRTYCTKLREHARTTSMPLSLLDHEWLLHSDTVELHHCRGAFVSAAGGNKNPMDWYNFTKWAGPLLNHTPALESFLWQQKQQNKEIIQQEMILELLELYLTHHGYCNFHQYHPTFQQDSVVLEQTELVDPPSNEYARLAFVIAVSQRDQLDNFANVQSLLQAIHMPQHYIILHVPSSTSLALTSSLKDMVAQEYDNVVVVQFGTVFDETDSMSLIHLKLMRWLVRELNFKYDYHVMLDGSSFPLLCADAFAKHMYESSQSVWLGTLLEKGKAVKDSHRHWLLRDKQLTITTTQTTIPVANIPLPSIPDFLVGDSLNVRTTPGRFAVFSHDIVTKLIDSPKVMELFAVSKYGCCGPLDQYNWFTALKLIDATKESISQKELPLDAKADTSMFQLWGGDSGDCQKALNAPDTGVLTMDVSKCYRIEYPQVVESVYPRSINNRHGDIIPTNRLTFFGNETMEYLRHAKQLGFLFARPFDSTNAQSVALRDSIEKSWKSS